ncbi:hypothetical protein Q1695_012750 [Nippostrongylus brasiliensis]|nr:hypothetical protein Q1695_012750 [Nippostrongylus brasiliensis]
MYFLRSACIAPIFIIVAQIEAKYDPITHYVYGLAPVLDGQTLYIAGRVNPHAVRILSNSFEVFVNKEYLGSYNNRYQLDQIHHLQIFGDCELDLVRWGRRYHEIPWKTQFAGGFLEADQQITLESLPLNNCFVFSVFRSGNHVLYHYYPGFPLVEIFPQNAFVPNSLFGIPPVATSKSAVSYSADNAPSKTEISANEKLIGRFDHTPMELEESPVRVEIEGHIEVSCLD